MFPNQLFYGPFRFWISATQVTKMGNTTGKSSDFKAWNFFFAENFHLLLCVLGRGPKYLKRKCQKVTNLCEFARRRRQDLHRRGLVGFPGVPKNMTVPTTDSSQNRGWRVGFGGLKGVRLFERPHSLRCLSRRKRNFHHSGNSGNMKQKLTSLHLCRHSMQGC